MKTAILIVDPQNDFCDPKGSLFVPGADKDMERLASIDFSKIDQIFVTEDEHKPGSIFFSSFWMGIDGKRPTPFSTITADDLLNAHWMAENRELNPRAVRYVLDLEEKNKSLTIWPEHCIEHTWGSQICSPLYRKLLNWGMDTRKKITIIEKGKSLFTEHYSAFKAEIPDLNDNETLLNTTMIEQIDSYDKVYIAGEALSHCVMESCYDLFENVVDIKKYILLADCMSPVAGHEQTGKDFLMNMSSVGVGVTSSVLLEHLA